MSFVEVAEQQNELTRERARDLVAKTFRLNRGLNRLDRNLALGTASVAFSTTREKKIWLEEIRRYEQEHPL